MAYRRNTNLSNIKGFYIENKYEKGAVIEIENKVQLASNLTKYRVQYLLKQDKAIVLTDNIYHQEYFKNFIKIATNNCNSDEIENNIESNSLYLYVYSDVWGFDYLKQKIEEFWEKNPEKLLINDEESDFLNDILSTYRKIPENSKYSYHQETSPRLFTPVKFFEKNIDKLFENEFLMDFPPEMLCFLLNRINTKYNNLKYYNFLMKYIKNIPEEKDDFYAYSTLIQKIDFSSLEIKDLENLVDKELANYNVSKYFDFITVRQFQDFSRKMISEYQNHEKAISDLKENVNKMIGKYKSKIAELKRKHEELQDSIDKFKIDNDKSIKEIVDNRLSSIETSLSKNAKEIKEIKENSKKLDQKYSEQIECNNSFEKMNEDYKELAKSVEEMNHYYSVSSYLVSSLNNQFFKTKSNENSFIEFKYELNEIQCLAKMTNPNQDKYAFNCSQNDRVLCLHFTNKNYNPSDQNSIEKFADCIVNEYSFEMVDDPERIMLSWCLEGYYPQDHQSYVEFSKNEKIKDDQWLPISIHSIADFGSNGKTHDILEIKGNVYSCSMKFGPICKFYRFTMIRNSKDDNVIPICNFTLNGKILEPFG